MSIQEKVERSREEIESRSQERRGLSLSKRTKDLVRKWRGQINFLTKVPLGIVYTYKEIDEDGKAIPGTERPRLDVKRGVALPGLVKAVLGLEVNEDGSKKFPAALIHLRNEQDPDPEGDSEYRCEIGIDVLASIHENGWLGVNSKHMLPKGVVERLSKTLPNAADFAAYARRFCAPLIGNGLHHNHEFIVKDILSKNRKGQIILAGSDGNGCIHPGHAIMIAVFGAQGRKFPLQVTVWNPERGTLFKGILVPDPRCVDEAGMPTIWLDWSMIKGAHKDFAKAMMGKTRGAFDENDVLIDSDRLMEMKRGKGFWLGILQTWCKPSLMSACFENLDKLRDEKATRTTVVRKQLESLNTMTEEGGLLGILNRIAEDKPFVKLTLKFCESLGLDPLSVAYLKSLADDESQRWLWQLAQGAGIKYDGYTAVLDNGIPPGRCIIAPYTDSEGVEHYGHGAKVAVTRVPVVLPQAMMVLINIDPRKKGWEHLSHYCYWLEGKGRKKLIVTDKIIVMNVTNCSGDGQGDADGDQMEVSDDPSIIEMHEAKICIGPFNKDAQFLIEGGRVKDGWKTKIKVWDPETNSIPEAAIRIVGMDGQGPVGLVSMYQAAFYALGMTMEALAMAVLIQRAIDAQKHEMLPADPFKLRNPANWYETEEGSNIWEHHGCDADPTDTEWEWIDIDGLLNIGTLVKWFSYVTNGAKLKDILTWRPEGIAKRGGKRLHPKQWKLQSSPRGENLVHFSNAVAHHLYHTWEKENITTLDRVVNLVDVLCEALGMNSPQPAGREDVGYKRLLNITYMTQFHRALQKIISQKLEADEKGPLIDAETDILHHHLQAMVAETISNGGNPIHKLLWIWATELDGIEEMTTGDRGKKVNRAFRAIAFPGSPILQTLNIEMDNPCSYMRDHLLEVVTHLENLRDVKLEDGGAIDIFHAVACWPEIDAVLHETSERTIVTHEDETGILAEDCMFCKRLLTSKVITVIRNDQRENDPELKKAIGTLVHNTNIALKEGV